MSSELKNIEFDKIFFQRLSINQKIHFCMYIMTKNLSFLDFQR